MKKWETLVFDFGGEPIAEQNSLNGKGKDGWELVCVIALPMCRRAYFKREIPDEPSVNEQPECARGEIVSPLPHPAHPAFKVQTHKPPIVSDAEKDMLDDVQ